MYIIKTTKGARVGGIDQPAAKVVHEDAYHIVLKVPGRKVWMRHGPGDTHDYIPAEYQSWEITSRTVDQLNVQREYSFPVRN